MIREFFTQPSRNYRNFQIVFTLLTLNFIIPAVSYSFFPDKAIAQFSKISEILGMGPYTVAENASRIWRYLGAANVMTLGVMCFLMQWNLRKYRVILFPLSFLKAYNASLYFLDFIRTGHKAFLAVALFDYLTTAAFLFFSIRAWHDIRVMTDDHLVPQPR